MSELIYKQDAIDLVKEVCDAIMSGCDSHYDPETEDEVYNDILEVDAILKCNKEIRIALANLPSAQPEIVRCKDCKWGRKVSGNIECFVDSNIPPEYHGYGWFCPNGER